MTLRIVARLSSLLVAAATVVTLYGITQPVAAVSVDDTPDCDTVAIIHCGAMTADALRTAYDTNATGDLPTIFNAFSISRADLDGSFVDGIVWRDGRVTVGDKTVATGATTAGRNYGGTPIAGTNAGIYSTSKFVDDGQTALVRMSGDRFVFAVVKPCSNPVKATPVAPAPVPGVTITKKVDSVDTKLVALNQEFTYQITVKNTGTRNLVNIAVTDTPADGITLRSTSMSRGSISNNQWSATIPQLASGESMTFALKAVVSTYTSQSLKNTACVDAAEIAGTPDVCDDATVTVQAPADVSVCNPATGTIISVKESDKDSYKPSTDAACNDTRVCVLATTQPATIKKSELLAHPTLYSQTLSECDTPKVLTTTTPLAKTGPADFAMGAAGLGSLTAAGYYFRASRRHLITTIVRK